MSLKDFQQKRNTLAGQMRNLHETIGENEWTVDQRTQWENMKGELDKLETQIQREEDLRALDQKVVTDTEPPKEERQANPELEQRFVFDAFLRHGSSELVYAQFLDARNFPNGRNPQADPTQESVSLFIIEQLKSLNDEVATFELALPAETDNARIPLLMITSDTCIWQYRSAECGYTGGPVADEKDNPATDPKKDACSHCLRGCKLRFGANAILPFGGFPSTTQYGA